MKWARWLKRQLRISGFLKSQLGTVCFLAFYITLAEYYTTLFDHCTQVMKWARWLKRQGLGYGLDGPGSIPGVGGGGDFSSLLRVQTGPEVHSASYKMTTGGFHWGKGGRA